MVCMWGWCWGTRIPRQNQGLIRYVSKCKNMLCLDLLSCVVIEYIDKWWYAKKTLIYIPSMGCFVGWYLAAVWHGERKQHEHVHISVDLAQAPLWKETEQVWLIKYWQFLKTFTVSSHTFSYKLIIVNAVISSSTSYSSSDQNPHYCITFGCE